MATHSQPLKPVTRSWLHYLPLIFAAALLIFYVLLPFITQPELGDTTVRVLTESRGNNELGINTNGLVLIPMAALGVALFGIWNLLNPRVGRAVAAFTALGGFMVLTYYVVFAMDYTAEEATYISQMGPAFWGVLVVAVLMIVQLFLPRPLASPKHRLGRLLGNQESIIALGLIFMLILVGISNPRFLAERNISDVLQGHAYVAVAAIGMSMVIITGNIDISVGSLIGLLAVISGRLVVAGAPIWFSWLAPLLVGAAVGALIGFLVAYMRIPSIVVTLGMLSILKGILIIWTNGERVTDMPEGFFLAQMRPLGIPMPIWFMIVLTIAAAIWMRYSGLGRSLYAVGGNAEAARLSGISQKRVVLQVFIINGIFVGFASILYATQFAIIQVTPPPGLELTIISSSVVGGVSILGGTGTVIGSTLAAILLNTIRSAMVFINVSPFWLQAVQGVLILVTVLADLLRRRRQID